MSISNSLEIINNIKNNCRVEISKKGVDINETTSFIEYPNKISQIKQFTTGSCCGNYSIDNIIKRNIFSIQPTSGTTYYINEDIIKPSLLVYGNKQKSKPITDFEKSLDPHWRYK